MAGGSLFLTVSLVGLASGRLLSPPSLSPAVGKAVGATRLLIGQGSAKSSAVVAKNNATLDSCAIASDGSKKHKPYKKPKNLAEFRDEAQGCLTWCGALKDKCFRGCLNTCTKALGLPPCAAFALDLRCTKGCKSFAPVFSCMKEITAKETAKCHLKLGEVKTGDIKDCKIKA
mmetsp:Transcript_76398/g.151124  ORF Transcript_76398/g.151124 Transcript_76398/m.151124 type:complete len:173 (-) Transcript_76398:37-555(-)